MQNYKMTVFSIIKSDSGSQLSVRREFETKWHRFYIHPRRMNEDDQTRW